MHEMSLCEHVLQMLESEAAARNATRVSRVTLEIGGLAGVDVDAMRFCFDVVVRNPIADGAELAIQTPDGRGWCMQCAKTVSISARFDPCPQCGSHQVQVVGGDELLLKSLEVH